MKEEWKIIKKVLIGDTHITTLERGQQKRVVVKKLKIK